MSFQYRLMIVLLLMIAAVAGCGGPQPVSGGTRGVLRLGDARLSDIQVTLHRIEDGTAHSIGYGVTGPDGRFELVQNGAKGPLWLTVGEYRVTLESVGPVPVRFPKDYARADTTPSKITWSGSDDQLDLEAVSPATSR